ncbi:hypothetical protein ACFVIN_19025 [Streptomyces prasinus]|uniref:hypothetical protein n=1 Tax=Streptomyces prasinus TaxID=67345 RepID=UPI0036312794
MDGWIRCSPNGVERLLNHWDAALNSPEEARGRKRAGVGDLVEVAAGAAPLVDQAAG